MIVVRTVQLPYVNGDVDWGANPPSEAHECVFGIIDLEPLGFPGQCLVSVRAESDPTGWEANPITVNTETLKINSSVGIVPLIQRINENEGYVKAAG